MSNTLDYEVGQVINIGYYGGFHNQERLISQAEIVKVDKVYNGMIDIKIKLKHGGYRKMFGYASELKKLENNYKEWIKGE